MSNSNFVHSIATFIKYNHLMDAGRKYLVALSGGADSVALLSVLNELGYHIEAVHCNFHLRGEESNRDESFCKRLCQSKNIPLHLASFDTTSFAKLHKISIEMAARRLRYHFFTQLCHDLSADGVCVGHHADDQVETVILNIIRGTGIDGLTGMKPRNNIVIRPLLPVGRQQILAYLQTLGQDYVTDSTNLVDDVQRNKVRLDVLPLLETVNSSVRRNIIHMAENLSESRFALEAQLNEAMRNAALTDTSEMPNPANGDEEKSMAFNVGRLLDYPSPQLLFWHILSSYGFNRPQVGEIARYLLQNAEINCNDHSIKLWKSHDFVALSDCRTLWIIERKTWERPFNAFSLPECGLYKRGDINCRVEEFPIERLACISRTDQKITIDSKLVVFPLTLRRTETGDKFTPYGMHGHKLVSDFLKDAHLNPITRKQQLVLTDATGKILWVVGLRIDDHYKVIMGKTRQILQVELINS